MGQEFPQSKPAGKCPFHQAPTPGVCPVAHTQSPVQADQPNGTSQAPSNPPHEGSEAAVCPCGHGSGSRPQADRAAAPVGGRCPFGYDTASSKPALTPFHCVLCESLLYDCVAAKPCDHRYCNECISRFQDCPLCGRDIDSLASDAVCQGEVDAFIEKHAQQPSHASAPEHKEGAYYGQGSSGDAASFFLELGLTSLSGRNYAAALARLERSKEALLQQGDHGAAGAKLGAVCGSQGDCCRQRGDMDGAAAYYQEGICHLQGLPSSNTEAQQALAVSLNKLGDLAYWQGSLPNARTHYQQALQVRQQLLAASSSGAGSQADDSALTAMKVDVGVSLGKLLDADKGLGESASANQLHAQATELVKHIGASVEACSAATRRKFAALEQLLQTNV